MESQKSGSVGSALGWMFLISLLLFWLPLFGPLVSGFVGGRKAGGVGNAIVAVFLPGVVFGVILFAIASSLSGAPLIGAIAGIGGFILAIVHIGPLPIEDSNEPSRLAGPGALDGSVAKSESKVVFLSTTAV
jgi:hypothetical protein